MSNSSESITSNSNSASTSGKRLKQPMFTHSASISSGKFKFRNGKHRTYLYSKKSNSRFVLPPLSRSKQDLRVVRPNFRKLSSHTSVIIEYRLVDDEKRVYCIHLNKTQIRYKQMWNSIRRAQVRSRYILVSNFS